MMYLSSFFFFFFTVSFLHIEQWDFNRKIGMKMKVFVFHDIKLLHDIDIKIYENHD